MRREVQTWASCGVATSSVRRRRADGGCMAIHANDEWVVQRTRRLSQLGDAPRQLGTAGQKLQDAHQPASERSTARHLRRAERRAFVEVGRPGGRRCRQPSKGPDGARWGAESAGIAVPPRLGGWERCLRWVRAPDPCVRVRCTRAAHRRRRARDRATSIRMVLTAALLASVGTIIPLAGQGPASAASSAPGVSPTRITTGAIATLSGPLAADSYGLVPGVQAYFDMINAHGGINGRRLDLAYPLDDGGNPSQFTSLTHALVDQDHVFAVAGVATVFFSPNYLAETGLPTYGYNVAGDWSGPPNLFASGGSVQCYTCVMPDFAYLINRSRSKSVALLAYGVAASRDACSTADTLFTKAGIHVSYVDLNVPIDGNVTPDVERMQRVGSDFVLSCMDVTNNISMARAINQYGMRIAQLWLDGNDQSVLNVYPNLMKGVYFFLQHVPFTAPTKYYPGLGQYLTAMRRFEPHYTYDELAIQGWESAALFAAGVRAAGNHLTQQQVIHLTNQMTDFTAGGLTTVTNWKNADTTSTEPDCGAFVRVVGKQFVPVFGRGHEVFLCFGRSVRRADPVAPPTGTPGS